MSNVRQALVFCAVLAALPAVHATPLGEGLRLNDPLPEGPSWQTRLAALPAPLLLPGEAMAGATLGGLRLNADRYFGVGRLGDGGGLRATSGLWLGSRLALGTANPLPGHNAPDTDWSALPYLGVGYSGAWQRSGLGLSADLGLLAQRPASGLRALGAGSGLENTVRAMQLSPVFQMQLSYAF